MVTVSFTLQYQFTNDNKTIYQFLVQFFFFLFNMIVLVISIIIIIVVIIIIIIIIKSDLVPRSPSAKGPFSA